jgi:hypothetical protein
MSQADLARTVSGDDTAQYSLIYTSQAVRPFSIEELDGLLEQSRRDNQRLGITGMLVH